MSKRTWNAVLCIAAVVAGGSLYLLYRADTHLAQWMAWLPNLAYVRGLVAGYRCDFLQYYFPDFLWGFSLCCGLSAVLYREKHGVWYAVAIGIVGGCLWEFLQWHHVVSGTADLVDVGMYLLAGVVARIINAKEIRK